MYGQQGVKCYLTADPPLVNHYGSFDVLSTTCDQETEQIHVEFNRTRISDDKYDLIRMTLYEIVIMERETTGMLY